jgi:RNA polymerase sigma factor (sigma-70 family)
MTDYRVDIKVRNNNILKMIESRGYPSARKFCLANGFCYKSIHELINMQTAPIGKNGKLRSIVYKLADTLICLPEELFSVVQMETALETNKRTLEVNEAEMQFMLATSVEPLMLEDQTDMDRLPEKMNEVLKTLTPREQKIISMRFGLGDYGCEHTLAEVAEAFGVARSRVAQIEAKALRKLRHPSRTRDLDDYRTFINRY